MKKIKKLTIMWLIIVFAAFLVFPSFLFAVAGSGYPDTSAITSVDPGECGEETIVCIEWDFGGGSLRIYIGLKVAGETSYYPGFPIGGAVESVSGNMCVSLGVLPPGDYDVYLRIKEGTSSTAHVNGRDMMTFTVGEDCGGTITVIKVDSDGTKLEGAGFTLLEPDESLAHSEKLTDSNGQLSFGMPYGDYIVRETTLPPGDYTGAADQAVTINKGNPDVTVTFVNTIPTKTTTEVEVEALTEEVEVLAHTGENPMFYIIGLLLVAVAGGLAFGLRAVKSKK